jgi:hypothetical protein
MTVIGWTDAYGGAVSTSTFTKDKEKALIERIKKRRYNFNHADHEFLPFASPIFDDRTTCVLNKSQWDRVMAEAYKDIPRGQRLMPQDVIEDSPIDGILYEKKKFYQEGEQNNG